MKRILVSIFLFITITFGNAFDQEEFLLTWNIRTATCDEADKVKEHGKSYRLGCFLYNLEFMKKELVMEKKLSLSEAYEKLALVDEDLINNCYIKKSQEFGIALQGLRKYLKVNNYKSDIAEACFSSAMGYLEYLDNKRKNKLLLNIQELEKLRRSLINTCDMEFSLYINNDYLER